jgi:hypothetical protein
MRLQNGQENEEKTQSQKEQSQKAINLNIQSQIQGSNVYRRLITDRNWSIPTE